MEQKFQNMDLGTQMTSVPMEKIEVEISTEGLLVDYAKAFVKECARVNTLKAEEVALTEEEAVAYAKYLLVKRIEVVNNDCKDFKRLKTMYIPSYLQYVLSMIGVVIDRERGLTFVPILEDTNCITLTQALKISEKIGAFENDLQVVVDAMPRDIEGNADTMQTAIVAGYLRGTRRLEHPAPSYIAAFLDMKLKQEAAFQALYRVRYDDLEFISIALLTQKGIF